MKFEKLYCFNNASAFFEIHKGLSNKEFLADNTGKPYREIWVASRFCYGLGQLRCRDYQVKLIDDVFPDFQLKKNAELLSFELVEVQPEDRKRGDEYKDQTEGLKELKILPKEEVLNTIRDAVQRKVDKYATFPCSLLCYINIPFPDINEKDVQEVTSKFKEQTLPFNEIWLFTNGKERTHSIARVYPDIEQLYLFELKK